MIDIHSHILFNIDDGAKSIEESIELIKSAKENGYDKIILTPHYIKDSYYNCNNQKKIELLNILNEELKRENIDVELFLANEVYIDQDIVELIKKSEVLTINNTRYILFELPLNSKYMYIENIIFELQKNNLIPILAHPERYISYYNDFEFFENLIEKGVLLQGNFMSLLGIYGKKPASMLKSLLKKDMIHFLGSDIHRYKNNYYENIEIAKVKLKKIIKDDKKINNLLNDNIEKILRNEEIDK